MVVVLEQEGDIDDRDFRARLRLAVRNFQASIGLVPDGFASASILARLRSQPWVPSQVPGADGAASPDGRALGVRFAGASWAAAR